MANYKECMCKVCEQKRLAAFEVDKLKGLLIKPMAADHEMRNIEVAKTQEDVEQLKVGGLVVEDPKVLHLQENLKAKIKHIKILENKILKQDKQFMELATEKEKFSKSMSDVINAAGKTIADLNRQLKIQENESEFWRLRAKQFADDNPVGVPPIKCDLFVSAAVEPGEIAKKITEEIKKHNGFYNGGCV